MKTKILLILIFSVALFLSCNKEQETNSQTPVQFTEIGKGALYGNGQESIPQSNLVIDNDTDWQDLMNRMNSYNNVTDNFNETNINFSQYEIIAIFLDIKPNGWEVEITTIDDNGSSLIVNKMESEADNTVMTQPFHIVKIPKTNLPIEFN